MKYTNTARITGNGMTSVRAAYSDYDIYGSGHVLGMTGGFLDAPETAPSGGSTTLAFTGSKAWEAQMNSTSRTHACTFTRCTCGGNGNTVHVRNC